MVKFEVTYQCSALGPAQTRIIEAADLETALRAVTALVFGRISIAVVRRD